MKTFISKKSLLLILVVLAYFSLYVYQAYRNIDPDFGWHLRLGELTSTQGVFDTDPFSYTMPSFPYIDHEWLSDVLLFHFYSNFGSFATAFLFSLIVFLTVGISFFRKPRRLSSVTFLILTFLISISMGFLASFSGIRLQIISWFLFAVFLNFIFNKDLFVKYFYVIPFFEVFWVNLHGSFPLPIVSLLIVSIAESIKLRKIWFLGFITTGLTVVATGINPYGFRIWNEVYQTVTDPGIRWVLIEWKPAFWSFNLYYILFVVLFVFTLKTYFTKFDLGMVFLNVFLFIQAFASIRHAPLWLIVNLPMAYWVLEDFYAGLGKIKFAKKRFVGFIKGGITLSLVMSFVILVLPMMVNSKELSEENFYPKQAVDYLNENRGLGNLFSEYGWGGYLLWKYPDKKTFIDGRMASWKQDINSPSESNYIMGEYLAFIKGDLDMTANFEKYDIDTILWPKHPVVSQSYAIESFFRNNILKKEPRKIFDPHDYFLNNGWQVVYEDEVSLVYRRKQ